MSRSALPGSGGVRRVTFHPLKRNHAVVLCIAIKAGERMYAAMFLKKLTAYSETTMLYPLSQKTKAGISTPFSKGEKSPVFALVFLCPSKFNAVFCRLNTIMVGCIGQSQGWPAPLPGSANPIQPASQRLAPMRGGYQPCKGDTAMRYYAQNPALSCRDTAQPSEYPPKPALKSVFKLVTRCNRVLLTELSLAEATALVMCYPALKIKFDRWEAVQ